jgi:hypothetical protein
MKGRENENRGRNASYLSKRHLNNQIYSLEDFINDENLYINEVFQIPNRMELE